MSSKLEWYVIRTTPRSELELSRYLSRTFKPSSSNHLVPSPKVSRARRHISRPYQGLVFFHADLTPEEIETIEEHATVQGFLREPETYLLEFEGGNVEDGGGVDLAIKSLNTLGFSEQIKQGLAPFLKRDAKVYKPKKGREVLSRYYKEFEGCDFPESSDFIEVEMYFTEHHRQLIREIPGIIDFVGGSHPLAKKGHAIQDSDFTPLKIKDQIIERFKGHQYQLYVLQTHSQFEEQVINALRHHRSMAEEMLFNKDNSDLFINSARFVANEEESIHGHGKKKFTGYIYLSMHMCIDSWHLVKSIPKVSGFVGGKNIEEVRPVSISEDLELTPTRTVESAQAEPSIVSAFSVGDLVDILDGPFATYMGQVQDVYLDQERLSILINPNRTAANTSVKDRSGFSADLNFHAEVEFKQVKKLD
jgi:transcription termination/antitermination protein NusG